VQSLRAWHAKGEGDVAGGGGGVETGTGTGGGFELDPGGVNRDAGDPSTPGPSARDGDAAASSSASKSTDASKSPITESQRFHMAKARSPYTGPHTTPSAW
jgi:hypothetical protein